MNTIAKKLSIALLAMATAYTPLAATTAQAESGAWQQEQRQWNNGRGGEYRQRHWKNGRRGAYKQPHYSGKRHHGRNRDGDAIALGILGLGAAAIIGGAIANSNNNPRVIYQQPSAPRAVRGSSYEPWSQAWYRFCANKYRSFNASTGTFRGYDGRDHFCVAN
ncbi:BA14K family protein [Hoeflea sp. YIM 152468]|uniref:BA14K family protein n=1 Tax=Hoeflea sp. YIM 152468 TaxID=3031759 RepID=UPI0023DCE7A9|nr:BA14K family protein [Hoeflea sp. YIM 152468]MDF1609666.1 BA14K family protein [Hoeflea sp. YIM 152468]